MAERSRPSSETFVNPAKTLAVDLAGSIPLVLGEGAFAGAAAVRAAAELARSARHPAVHGTLPDDATTVVATFDGPFAGGLDDVFADPFDDPTASTSRLRLLLLRDDEVDLDTRQVTDVVRDTAIASGVRVNELAADRHACPGPHRRAGRSHGLRLGLPGARRRPRPRDVAARRRPQGAHRPMSTSGGTRAIVAALLANLGIAVTKFIAFLVSGSSSMLAEAVHSLADSGNQVLLLVGGRRAQRGRHPRAPLRLRP